MMLNQRLQKEGGLHTHAPGEPGTSLTQSLWRLSCVGVFFSIMSGRKPLVKTCAPHPIGTPAAFLGSVRGLHSAVSATMC